MQNGARGEIKSSIGGNKRREGVIPSVKKTKGKKEPPGTEKKPKGTKRE